MFCSRRCSLIASYSKTTSLRSKGNWVAAAHTILRLPIRLEFTAAQEGDGQLVRLGSVDAQHACVVPMVCAFIYVIQHLPELVHRFLKQYFNSNDTLHFI